MMSQVARATDAARTDEASADSTSADSTSPDSTRAASPLAHRLGRAAVASLHAELACAPKPGLVTPFDSGSHDDMDAATFMRSLFALRGYFVAIAEAGTREVGFDHLRQLGIAAEADMLRATHGINTHRGAIFSLGLLAAQAARLHRRHGRAASAEAVCLGVREWTDDLLHAPLDHASHGQRARARFRVAGVREQAADGYPVLRQIALPALRDALARGLPRETALAQTLIQLIAQIDDLNLLHRGGLAGLRRAQRLARGFLADGGATQPQWRRELSRISEAFVADRLSPGGSADLLACAWFLHVQEGIA
ncbi:triphosphoribosyl-dephospho-CoA synthase MdcB [Lysobacter sp. CA199]|uniref:triphosphoribosyl-dephospho-CoA synthase MdcB n=1 Tax=Lysobacter sp. CA199 TaxID=3455608 RepID=UPI003F8D7EF9